MNIAEHLFAVVGTGGLATLLLVLGLLSKRMSETMNGKPYFRMFFLAGLLCLISMAARLVSGAMGVADDPALGEHAGWVLLYHGLPALALSIGLRTAWHYWSWLLAERD